MRLCGGHGVSIPCEISGIQSPKDLVEEVTGSATGEAGNVTSFSVVSLRHPDLARVQDSTHYKYANALGAKGFVHAQI